MRAEHEGNRRWNPHLCSLLRRTERSTERSPARSLRRRSVSVGPRSDDSSRNSSTLVKHLCVTNERCPELCRRPEVMGTGVLSGRKVAASRLALLSDCIDACSTLVGLVTCPPRGPNQPRREPSCGRVVSRRTSLPFGFPTYCRPVRPFDGGHISGQSLAIYALMEVKRRPANG